MKRRGARRRRRREEESRAESSSTEEMKMTRVTADPPPWRPRRRRPAGAGSATSGAIATAVMLLLISGHPPLTYAAGGSQRLVQEVVGRQPEVAEEVGGGGSARDRSSFSFYDDLRASPTATSRPLVLPGRGDGDEVLGIYRDDDADGIDGEQDWGGTVHIGRNLHRVDDPEMLGDDEEDGVVLCHIPFLLRYTRRGTDDGDKKGRTSGDRAGDAGDKDGTDVEADLDAKSGEEPFFEDVSPASFGGSAAGLLAIHHFNNGIDTIVKELKDVHETCNIRLTTEIIDTQSSPIVAVHGLTHLITRPYQNLRRPQPCAVVGTTLSSETTKMATLTGVNDLLQVSSAASSVALDDKVQYPLFARTHPSDAAMGMHSVHYLKMELGVTYFGLLFVNDVFGSSFQKVVQDTAAQYGMVMESASFRPNAASSEIRAALQILKSTRFNYFIGVMFGGDYEKVMDIAAEEDVGVAGPGKFWLLAGSLATSFVDGETRLKSNSRAARATVGNAIIHDEGGLPGLPQYDRFVAEWRKIGENSEAVDYINSKQPRSPYGTNLSFERPKEHYNTKPSHIDTFTYDAIIGIGLSACVAQNASSSRGEGGGDDTMFTGEDHHAWFTDCDFVGATGDVVIGPNSFSRNASSTYFFVSNILERVQTAAAMTERTNRSNDGENDDGGGWSVFRGTPLTFFDYHNGAWTPYSVANNNGSGRVRFVYSDGTTVPPKDLPEQMEQMNYLSPAVRGAGLLLAIVASALSIGTFIFTVVKRDDCVIRASQPPFLTMISFGTLLMASAIIPLSIDDSKAGTWGCSVACTSIVWLFCTGFVVTFAALYSKTRRINKVLGNSIGFKRVKVTLWDVIKPLLTLLGFNFVVLVVWTVVSPIYWSREVLAMDVYGRSVASLGGCHSDQWLPYVLLLILINGCALILSVYQAYLARNVTTEFGESKYIAMSMISIFQALFIGVPIIFLTRGFPTAYFFTLAGIDFIVCSAIQLLIFVPKMLIMQKGVESVPGYQRSGNTWLVSSALRRAQSSGGRVLSAPPSSMRRPGRTAMNLSSSLSASLPIPQPSPLSSCPPLGLRVVNEHQSSGTSSSTESHSSTQQGKGTFVRGLRQSIEDQHRVESHGQHRSTLPTDNGTSRAVRCDTERDLDRSTKSTNGTTGEGEMVEQPARDNLALDNGETNNVVIWAEVRPA